MPLPLFFSIFLPTIILLYDTNGDCTFFCKSCSEELDLNSAMIVALCDLYKIVYIVYIREYNTLERNTQNENGNVTEKNNDEYKQWLTDIKDKIAETNIARNGQLRSDYSGIKLSR